MQIDAFGMAALIKQSQDKTHVEPLAWVEDWAYPPEVRAELGLLLAETPPGGWGQLGLCPGPYGCPYTTEAEAVAAGARENFCPGCRVIRAYRAEAPL